MIASNPSWTDAFAVAFDATDAQFQRYKDFGPDKGSSWAFPAEKDGWMLAHNSIRGELVDIESALSVLKQRDMLDKWEITALQSVWSAHNSHIVAHHFNEDDKLIPFLATRIYMPVKLGNDHVELLTVMDRIGELFSGLSGLSDSVAELLAAWSKYGEKMRAHLEEEERVALQLMRAYFTHQEIAPVVKEIVAGGPPVEMGSFIHYAGDESFFEFMKQEGIPGFVWYIDFKSKRDNFRRDFKGNIEALIDGTPPPPSSVFCCQRQRKIIPHDGGDCKIEVMEVVLRST